MSWWGSGRGEVRRSSMRILLLCFHENSAMSRTVNMDQGMHSSAGGEGFVATQTHVD